ncbi:hypothetical protein [Sulfitobacter sp.]|uniref:hypothetical protein n=1 Tax=Sulfitobacter sp. TaxID=1903071 RepID=UPI003298D5E9
MLVWLWLSLSAALLLWGSSGQFLRAGSIGILYAGLHFGIFRTLVEDADRLVFETETGARLALLYVSYVDLHFGDYKASITKLASFDEVVGDEGQSIVTTQRRKNYTKEATVFCLGTLQLGYGDLLHCLIHGNGWKTC